MKSEKLTLEMLAPYLPYGLLLKGDTITPIPMGFEIGNVHPDTVITSNYWKPLLIPLSELNKNFCLNNGESITNYISVKQMERIRSIGANIPEQTLFSIDYGHVVGLFKLHFDVFDLINKRLALNKLDYGK